MNRFLRTLASVVAVLLMVNLAAPRTVRAETDPRDYEALVALPSHTALLIAYYRHITSSDTENLSENLVLFRTVYTLKLGNISLVPIDFILPVADVQVNVTTGATSSLVLNGSGIGDLIYVPTILYTLPQDKLSYTYFGFSPYFFFPTGNFDKTKVINIGGNRLAVEPEIMFGQRYQMFNLELVGNVTLYGDSNDHLNPTTGTTFNESQDPTFGLAVHATMDISPIVYLGASYYFFNNGAIKVSGTDVEVTPSQTVHSARFSWAIRLEKASLLLLQYNQDFHVTGGASISRWFGARISTFF